MENKWIVKEILKHEPVSNNQHRYPAIRCNLPTGRQVFLLKCSKKDFASIKARLLSISFISFNYALDMLLSIKFVTIKYSHFTIHNYSPNCALISNILSIGFLAAALKPSSMVISGNSYFIHKYSFSNVFSFM